MSRAASQTTGRDLSFNSLGKEIWYLFVSWAASASETALATSAESSLGEKESQPEPEPKGLPDILFGDGRKVLVEEVGEGGEVCVGVVKINRMGAMSKY